MNSTEANLAGSIERFVTARKALGGVSAVLLYGSYARGTQHEKSDVDIIFVVDQGFKSELLVYEGMEFEVLEATKSSMYDYWQQHWDEDRHWYLWKDVKTLYDRHGEGAEIVKHAMSLVAERRPWTFEHIESREQVELTKLGRIEYLSQSDPGTAAILLVEFVGALAESWFRIRGRFVPSPKEFLAVYAQECPEFGNMLRDFHLNSADLNARLVLANSMLKTVFR